MRHIDTQHHAACASSITSPLTALHNEKSCGQPPLAHSTRRCAARTSRIGPGPRRLPLHNYTMVCYKARVQLSHISVHVQLPRKAGPVCRRLFHTCTGRCSTPEFASCGNQARFVQEQAQVHPALHHGAGLAAGHAVAFVVWRVPVQSVDAA
jgi:hypothetical protein